MRKVIVALLASVCVSPIFAQADQKEPAMSTVQITPTAIESLKEHVRRDGDRVWIEGVHGYGFDQRVSSVHSAQAAVAERVGAPITYDELVGASGLAFRVQVHPEFCPSSPHSCCGYRCVENSSAAVPWETEHFGADNSTPEREQQIRRAVMESIDRGVPVQYGDIEDGVVYGYQANGNEWLTYHPLHDMARKPHVEKTLTWGVLIYKAPKALPSSRAEIAKTALKQAAAMWHAKRAPDKEDGYHTGDAAWGFWIGELEKLTGATPEVAGKIQHGNAWIYDALTACRRSAAIYLRTVAPEFKEPAAGHLIKAANIYDRMANQVLSDPDHCVTVIAPYVSDKPWTTEQRQEQLRRMREAYELDRQAIAELEMAITQ